MILPRCLVSICSNVDEHYKEFKEGGVIMIEIRRRAKKGLEDVEVLIKNKLDNLEKEIRREFETRKAELDALLLDVTEEYEADIPDECSVAPAEPEAPIDTMIINA